MANFGYGHCFLPLFRNSLLPTSPSSMHSQFLRGLIMGPMKLSFIQVSNLDVAALDFGGTFVSQKFLSYVSLLCSLISLL